MDSVSCSMQIDYGKAIVDYNQLQTRTLLSWQDDINVTKCPGCTKSFSFLKRKHHCRYCGYIYCHDCSNNVMVIPEFIKIPSCHAGYKTNRKDPMRVCNLCRHKLYQLSLLRSIIEVFNNCVEMSIQDIRGLSRVCKLWHQYANYYLSQFRSIQYELPYRKILATEKRLLWMNRGFIPGHDIWLSQLFRSIDFINDRHLTPELLLLLDQHRKESIKNKYKCRNIMCTRRCRPGLSIESALLLCDRKILSSEIVGYALETFHDMEDDKLLRYVPYLLDQGLKSPLPEIFQFLIKKCKNNVKVANELYWGIRMGLQSDNPLVINKF